jgi:hypothetical protein
MAAALVALMVYEVGNRRGVGVGAFALVFFGSLLALAVLRPQQMREWSKRHTFFDSMLFAPLLFLLLAYIANWSLLACAVGGVVGGAILSAVVLLRGRSRAGGQSRG